MIDNSRLSLQSDLFVGGDDSCYTGQVVAHLLLALLALVSRAHTYAFIREW